MVRNVSVTEKEAAWYYHHPDYHYNCAQAIVHHYGGNQEEIRQMSKMGSGRAPNGNCGALHGGLYLLRGDKKSQQEFLEIFSKRAGSPACRQLRQQKKVSCRQCVKIADRALLKILQKTSADD